MLGASGGATSAGGADAGGTTAVVSGGTLATGGSRATGGSSATVQPCVPAKTISGGQSGNFNTLGAYCFRTSDTINGWGCSNFDGRTLLVNDVPKSCGSMPMPMKYNGYYFEASAGTYAWASIYWW